MTGEAYTSESYEEATSEEITASASEAYEEPVSETSFFKTPVSSEPSTSESESVSIPKEIEIDPVTALAKDSEYLYEEQIGKEMVKLVELRAKLQTAEEELANVILQLETSLLNLRNVVHVKKIMFEHLKKELETTRKEWAEAYNEYLNTDQRRKTELEERTRQIEEIRKHIEEIGKTVRGRVSDLEMKRLSE